MNEWSWKDEPSLCPLKFDVNFKIINKSIFNNDPLKLNSDFKRQIIFENSPSSITLPELFFFAIQSGRGGCLNFYNIARFGFCLGSTKK